MVECRFAFAPSPRTPNFSVGGIYYFVFQFVSGSFSTLKLGDWGGQFGFRHLENVAVFLSCTVGDRVTNQMKYHFMGRCFLVACCSFIHDRILAWLLSTSLCRNMKSTDIPCRLFEPSSRRASVSIVSLVTHAGISSLMVVARVVDSHAFFKFWTRVHRYWLQCRSEK